MKAVKGFTLLEILLVLTLLALSATLVMMVSDDDRKKAITAGEQLAALMEYTADWSTMEDRSAGIEIRERGWRIVTPVRNRWQPPENYFRLATEGDWHDSWRVTLSPASLARQAAGTPQILIRPDGEITPFTLQIQDRQSRAVLFTLTSTGGLPLQFSSGATP